MRRMKDTPQHLKIFEDIERECIPDLVEVLREEGIEGVRYSLWDMTNWHRDYDPCIWRSRATEEQKWIGWEMWVRVEKILCAVLREAYNQQIEETMNALSEGPESFYGKALKSSQKEEPVPQRDPLPCGVL
jgi:hypothetical protein